MRTHMLKYRRFVCCCIFFLTLPWRCLCGEGENAAAQMVSLEVLIERFNQTEGKGVAYDKANPPSDNWGGESAYACQIVNAMSRRGDRAALPFLEEKCLSTNLPSDVRSRAALAYANLATAEECAAFLPKILKIDDTNKKIISWRDQIVPACLNKIEAAIDKRELPNATVQRLVDSFVAYTQSAYYSNEAALIDNFLLKHCDGYQISKQRLFLWTRILDADKDNEAKKEHYLPIKESVEAIPPRKRVDLRDRFTDLPPLPEGKTGKPLKIVLAVVVVAALAAVCAAIRTFRRGKSGR